MIVSTSGTLLARPQRDRQEQMAVAPKCSVDHSCYEDYVYPMTALMELAVTHGRYSYIYPTCMYQCKHAEHHPLVLPLMLVTSCACLCK